MQGAGSPADGADQAGVDPFQRGHRPGVRHRQRRIGNGAFLCRAPPVIPHRNAQRAPQMGPESAALFRRNVERIE